MSVCERCGREVTIFVRHEPAQPVHGVAPRYPCRLVAVGHLDGGPGTTRAD
jgi:hypothetical protein